MLGATKWLDVGGGHVDRLGVIGLAARAIRREMTAKSRDHNLKADKAL